MIVVTGVGVRVGVVVAMAAHGPLMSWFFQQRKSATFLAVGLRHGPRI